MGKWLKKRTEKGWRSFFFISLQRGRGAFSTGREPKRTKPNWLTQPNQKNVTGTISYRRSNDATFLLGRQAISLEVEIHEQYNWIHGDGNIARFQWFKSRSDMNPAFCSVFNTFPSLYPLPSLSSFSLILFSRVLL